jgi:hypothetical protein
MMVWYANDRSKQSPQKQNLNLLEMFVWLLFSLALACPSSNGSFVPVSFHVSYWNTQSTSSHHLAVFFPGFSVLLEDSEVWVETLVNANLVSSTQHVFATAGPEDPLFKKREIDTKLLASCVSSRVTPETNLLVFAHSSGAFVAYSFLNEFFKLGPALNSSTYYCLDGGVLGFTPAMLQNLTRVVAVNAQDSQSGIKVRFESAEL